MLRLKQACLFKFCHVYFFLSNFQSASYAVQSRTRQCKHNAIKPVLFGIVVVENSAICEMYSDFQALLRLQFVPKFLQNDLKLPLGNMFGISRSPLESYGTQKVPTRN